MCYSCIFVGAPEHTVWFIHNVDENKDSGRVLQAQDKKSSCISLARCILRSRT